jgi:uncharacterized protein (TIGR02996 family)
VPTDREILEAALAADFDDLAAHRAYADLLSEQGDPRGEFIQAQLLLQTREISAAERARLNARETELLAAHKREWLGGLAAHLDRQSGTESGWPNCRFEIVRGWVRSIFVEEIDRTLIKAICRCPIAGLLQNLGLYDVSPEDSQALHGELLAAPFLATLRMVQLGQGAAGLGGPGALLGWSEEELAAFVARLARVEELFLAVMRIGTTKLFGLPLPHLRELSVTGADSFALDVLAANPTLGKLQDLSLEPPNPLEDGEPSPITLAGLRAICRSPHLGSLTRLRLWRSDFGDDGVRELIDSGRLSRLTLLDLSKGAITDQGAALLARQPELAGMEVNLDDNSLTDEGVALVEAAGEEVRAGNQHEPGSTDYLYEFDME